MTVMKKILFGIAALAVWVVFASAQDVIRGTYSYTYGDKETLVEARQTCKDLAIRDAIESYYLYVESSSRVENNVLKNDMVGSLAAGYIKNLKIVDQKEEGRTVTITVEAEVNPEEVNKLVEKKLAEKPPATADTASTPASVQPAAPDFAVFLSKYENRVGSAEKELDQNSYDQALNQLQEMETLLASFPKRENDRFQTLMMSSLSLRNRILMDFARWDRVHSGGRAVRERVAERAIRLKMRQLENDLTALRNLGNLTEKQKAVRSVWLMKCQQLAAKVKKAIG
jgi:hypothetical protein